jgi:hypothetical protein
VILLKATCKITLAEVQILSKAMRILLLVNRDATIREAFLILYRSYFPKCKPRGRIFDEKNLNYSSGGIEKVIR